MADKWGKKIIHLLNNFYFSVIHVRPHFSISRMMKFKFSGAILRKMLKNGKK
jgi:hypothetical protein